MAYKPFKMKGHTLPGINQRIDANPKNVAAQGLAGSSPLQQKRKGVEMDPKTKTRPAVDFSGERHGRDTSLDMLGKDPRKKKKGGEKGASPAKQKKWSDMSDKEKRDLFSEYNFERKEETLPEKLKRRRKETQIFSPEQQEKRKKASFRKKLHKDVMKAIGKKSEKFDPNIPWGSKKSPAKQAKVKGKSPEDRRADELKPFVRKSVREEREKKARGKGNLTREGKEINPYTGPRSIGGAIGPEGAKGKAKRKVQRVK